MIGSVSGILRELTSDSALVEVGGLGYEVHLTGSSVAELVERKGQSVFLWTYTHVREDALQLFGFLSVAEKSLFLSLLKVSGIGPKMALAILSGERVDHIARWIEEGNVKSLSGLPKVGKKTAEQMILTLKGKLVLGETEAKQKKGSSLTLEQTQMVSALVNLGFKSSEVEKLVASFPIEITFEDGVRRGLQALNQG